LKKKLETGNLKLGKADARSRKQDAGCKIQDNCKITKPENNKTQKQIKEGLSRRTPFGRLRTGAEREEKPKNRKKKTLPAGRAAAMFYFHL